MEADPVYTLLGGFVGPIKRAGSPGPSHQWTNRPRFSCAPRLSRRRTPLSTPQLALWRRAATSAAATAPSSSYLRGHCQEARSRPDRALDNSPNVIHQTRVRFAHCNILYPVLLQSKIRESDVQPRPLPVGAELLVQERLVICFTRV